MRRPRKELRKNVQDGRYKPLDQRENGQHKINDETNYF